MSKSEDLSTVAPSSTESSVVGAHEMLWELDRIRPLVSPPGLYGFGHQSWSSFLDSKCKKNLVQFVSAGIKWDGELRVHLRLLLGDLVPSRSRRRNQATLWRHPSFIWLSCSQKLQQTAAQLFLSLVLLVLGEWGEQPSVILLFSTFCPQSVRSSSDDMGSRTCGRASALFPLRWRIYLTLEIVSVAGAAKV